MMAEAPAASRRVAELLREARARLRAAGCDTPELDAELLLAHALGVARPVLHLRPGGEAPAPAAARFAALVARREAREPVAYLVGRRGFRWIELRTDRRALVPRPETELLVEAGLELPAGARVVDVGTGSGAVALALKHERPDLELVGTDSSPEAIELARENARELGLAVSFVVCDLLEGVAGPVDGVVSNPPYVATGESLAPELAHEPARALLGGPDGLDVVRRLIPRAASRAPWVAVEVGSGQAARVAALMSAHGLGQVQARRDLAGHERVVVGRAR